LSDFIFKLPDTVPEGAVVYSQIILTEGHGNFAILNIKSFEGHLPF